MIKCPACAGKGAIYSSHDGDEIPKDLYDALPTDERMSEGCVHCDGSGEVADDTEPYCEY